MDELRSESYIYHQIRNDMVSKMNSGELVPGNRLPTIESLGAHYQCHYHTVRRALRKLIDQDLMESIRGSGTYIKDKSRWDELNTSSKLVSVIVTTLNSPISHQFCSDLQDLSHSMNLELQWIFTESIHQLNLEKSITSSIDGTSVMIPWFQETEEEITSIIQLKKSLNKPVLSLLNVTDFEVAVESVRSQNSVHDFFGLKQLSLILLGKAQNRKNDLMCLTEKILFDQAEGA
jgi:DNA-binding transcriptional regulator YhcF (GntR family)